MRTIEDKILSLGGELAGPASAEETAALEARLGVELPLELRDFLLAHNGSAKETEEEMWKFWTCAEITSHTVLRREEFFCPDNNALREIDASANAAKLPGSKLILFADVLIDLPTYGVYLDPEHQFHGMVFDASTGYVSSRTFAEWARMFIDRAEDCLLFPEGTKPEPPKTFRTPQAKGSEK